jgi:putative mycofactocin binding protein MftB
MDFSRSYRLARGFSFRREPFGGIIYHFEGTRPDPRLYFVDSPFLIGLLELLEEAPLAELVGQVKAHFGLSPEQVGVVRDFLQTLGDRGAFVAR